MFKLIVILISTALSLTIYLAMSQASAYKICQETYSYDDCVEFLR